MLKKRIIPCLDVKNGRVVKGKKFTDIQDVCEPTELASYYSNAGADELVFYDITASSDNHETSLDFVKAVAACINIPFSVGGGVRSLEDFDRILKNGADKVSINSSAYKSPGLINAAAKKYGNQCVVVSMDVKKVKGVYKVFIHGGRKETEKEAVDWAKEVVKRGAGELVINSIDVDGMQSGYDTVLLKSITEAVNVPIIASGGAGLLEHFLEAIDAGVDGVLAASVFHYKTIEIKTLKAYLQNNSIAVRMIK